jgi:hypothetical protein
MPTFTTNVGTGKSPSIIIDGQSVYENLDFKVYKPKDFFGRITINVTDENGDPIKKVGGHLWYVDGGMHDHVYAKAERQQFTSKDGSFDSDNIWPTNRPVKLHLSVRDEFSDIFTSRQAQTKEFIIEPKGEYHFDITLPFVRKVQVQVTGVNGEVVEGVSIRALDKNGMTIYPRTSNALNGVMTDSEGEVELSRLVPGEKFRVSVQRLDADNPDPKQPVASALFDAVAGKDLTIRLKQVVFDETPVTIEGYFLSDDPIVQGWVLLMVGGERGQHTMPYVMGKIDESGKFKLEGVPAGHIRLMINYRDKDNKSVAVEGVVDTLAGHGYTVEVGDRQIEVVDDKAKL